MRRATPEEKAAWHAAGEIYPLHGFIRNGPHECPVEDLRAYWPADDPQWEVHAPAGFQYTDGAHSHLCWTLRDVAGYGRESLELDTEME